MTAAVRTTRLGNGLLAVVREVRGAPVASFWVFYRVGSRNEVPGITGVSHWVEHMLFKGTPTWPKGSIFRSISKVGGTLNAFTWLDWTAYFATVPSEHLDLPMRVEADRMVNATFDPAEVESERTVIIAEREGHENRPTYHLMEELRAAAFRAHPYGHSVIGWKTDLRSMTRDDLYGHYQRYYTPNNAIAIAVGDVDADATLRRIEELFGAIPPRAEPPPVRVVEPPQEAERRVILRRPSPTGYFDVAYRTPNAASPDVYPFLLLDAVLSGADSMAIMGGRDTTMGRSSRLYRALVETGLVSAVDSGLQLTKDPYLFSISATLRPETPVEQVERIVFEEVRRLQEELVSEAEFESARKQVRAQFAYGAEGVTNQAFWLGHLEVVDRWQTYDEFLARIDAVSREDLRRVAATYLTETRRTVGWLIPTSAAPVADPTAVGAATAVHPIAGGSPPEPKARGHVHPVVPGIRRAVLPNGIVVLGHEKRDLPAVVLRAAARAGSVYEPEARAGLARLTGRMLLRGTERRSAQALNETTDRVGAALTVDVGWHVVQVNGRCLQEDFDLLAELVADILQHPSFPSDELERVRGQVLTSLREEADSTRAQADRHFLEAAYPPGHPYRRRSSGTIPTVETIHRDDLVAYHRQHFRPDNLVVAVVGDVDFDRALDALARWTERWQPVGAAPSVEIPPAPPPNGLVRVRFPMEAKTQADLVVGRPALSRKDPDYYPLALANLVLGQLGLSGRLGERVRDELGLAYTVYSSLEASFGPGPWSVRAGVNPRDLDRAIEAIRGEIRRLLDQPITVEELQDAQSHLIGILHVALETSGGIAQRLLEIELFDLGLDYLERYPTLIRSVTREAALEASRRYLSADDVVVSTAGPPAP